jgi:hypothetical protein
MAFFKDKPSLISAPLAPPKHYASPLPLESSVLGRLARTYNALGGLIEVLAGQTNTDPVAVLAVWYVESGGRKFTAGKPIIRFENHKFFQFWGHDHADQFDQHFQFGGRGGMSGRAHKNHKFSRTAGGPFAAFHGNQTSEHEVLDFATGLGNREEACLSMSVGGPQIMGFNHRKCGYDSAITLFDQFALDERWHLLGFFDFVQSTGLMDELQTEDWFMFGTRYNGDGATYGPLLKAAFDNKKKLKALTMSA